MTRVGLCIVMLACATNGHVSNDEGPAGGDAVDLPAPRHSGERSVEEAILGRRSVRAYTSESLTLRQIGQLLWAGQGVTDLGGGFRAAPSAGATYPMTLYLLREEGTFRYDHAAHQLIPVHAQDQRPALRRAALDQAMITEAPVSIVVVGEYARTTGRYGERGVRFVHIEAGHIAQNVHLQAVALGLGSVPVGAFDDDAVRDVLGVSDDVTPLYIIPIGHVRQAD